MSSYRIHARYIATIRKLYSNEIQRRLLTVEDMPVEHSLLDSHAGHTTIAVTVLTRMPSLRLGLCPFSLPTTLSPASVLVTLLCYPQ